MTERQPDFQTSLSAVIKASFPDDPRYAGMDELRAIVDALPMSQYPGEYWFRPDVVSPENRRLWEDAAELLSAPENHWGERTRAIAREWASDALIGAGLLRQALDTLPLSGALSRATGKTERRVSLKMILGVELDGHDIVGLFGNSMTQYGLKKVDEIMPYLHANVLAMQVLGGRDLLAEWMKPQPDGGPMFLFSGYPGHVRCAEVPPLCVNWESPGVQNAKKIISEAENTFREESGIPRIGEGWVAETELFYAVKNRLSDCEVLQHARPSWLGRQHLDVFVPDLKVAIEYQGLQHDQPVAFFGGEKAFEQTKMRDQRKLRFARKNGVRIIYVREGYDLDNLLREIFSG